MAASELAEIAERERRVDGVGPMEQRPDEWQQWQTRRRLIGFMRASRSTPPESDCGTTVTSDGEGGEEEEETSSSRSSTDSSADSHFSHHYRIYHHHHHHHYYPSYVAHTPWRYRQRSMLSWPSFCGHMAPSPVRFVLSQVTLPTSALSLQADRFAFKTHCHGDHQHHGAEKPMTQSTSPASGAPATSANPTTRSYAAVAASPQQKSEAGGRQADNDEKDAIGATFPPLPQPKPSDDVLEQKPLVKSDGPPSTELAKDPLSQQMLKLYESTRHSEGLLRRKLILRDLLASHIMQLPFFRMSGLYVVGSSLNGFGNNSSDMDVCLMFTEEEIDQRTEAIQVLVAVEELFNTLRFVRETNLIRAKVPILRVYFNAPYADIIVDLNANNSVAIRNTHMLCHYAGFDWRVQPLVVVVKEWARRRHINDANRSSFSSYSLVLMVVHYLQCGVKNPVLPSLQALYPHLFNSETNVRTLSLTETLPPLSQMNGGEDWRHNWDTTLGELLVGFFHYYSHVFDFDRFAISVRLGQVVDRTTVANMVPPNLDLNDAMIWRSQVLSLIANVVHNELSQWHFVCIEEPFSLMNTAHSIYDMMVFDSIKRSFREAYDQLCESTDLDVFLDNARPIHFATTMVTHPVG